MENYETRNALISEAKITMNDRGFLDCWLHLDYGGSGQGFGGWVLYLPKSSRNHKLESVAGHFIFRCMEIAGVESFELLKGKVIRVKSNHCKIHAIGHAIKEDWFTPSEDFAKLKD